MFEHFSPKRAFLVSWGTEFGQKTGKWSVFSSYNPKFSILEPKCGPKKIWKFWSHGPPLTPPYPPWHPPGVRGGQKWPKCIPSSPLMIIYAKKAISGGSKKLTYFFTRNVPNVFNISVTVTIYCAHWHFLVCCCWLVGLPLWCRVWEIGQDWGLNGGPTPHHHPAPQQHRHQQQEQRHNHQKHPGQQQLSSNSNCNSTVHTSN